MSRLLIAGLLLFSLLSLSGQEKAEFWCDDSNLVWATLPIVSSESILTHYTPTTDPCTMTHQQRFLTHTYMMLCENRG